jgi:hypothetical protein
MPFRSIANVKQVLICILPWESRHTLSMSVFRAQKMELTMKAWTFHGAFFGWKEGQRRSVSCLLSADPLTPYNSPLWPVIIIIIIVKKRGRKHKIGTGSGESWCYNLLLLVTTSLRLSFFFSAQPISNPYLLLHPTLQTGKQSCTHALKSKLGSLSLGGNQIMQLARLEGKGKRTNNP